MSDELGNAKISLRLADGRPYPLLLHEQTNQQHVLLVPAHAGQKAVSLNFTYHPLNGSGPVWLGLLQLTDLPESKEVELKLEVSLDSAEKFHATVSIENTGRTEKLEVVIPSERRLKARRKKKPFWFFGILFIGSILLLIAWVAFQVAALNKAEPLPPPSSVNETPSKLR